LDEVDDEKFRDDVGIFPKPNEKRTQIFFLLLSGPGFMVPGQDQGRSPEKARRRPAAPSDEML
jgi:hypothetical protein